MRSEVPLLDGLDAVLNTMEFEEHGALWVGAARWGERDCELLLDVRTGDDADPRQVYRISCAEVRSARVTGSRCDHARLLSDHPLLLRYASPHAQLAFKGRSYDPRELVGDLWQTHEALFASWEPLTAFLNGGIPLVELLGSGNGILAERPRVALERYAAVLADHGVEPSFFGERPAMRWTESGWQPEFGDLRAFVAGDDYVLGIGFEIEQVPEELLKTSA